MKTDQINIKKIDKIKMRKIIISNIYKKDIKKWRYNKKILTFNFYNNIIFIFYKLLYYINKKRDWWLEINKIFLKFGKIFL